MGATGPDAGGDPLARWSERMEKQRRKDEEEAAKRQVRYTTIPTRTTHLQVHCFDNKGAYTADELLAEDATIRKSTAGATRRRMILHDRLARTIDGWRYELDEERAKPGRRAAPGATAVDELVQPRGYTARGEVVANSGGHHLRNQRTRHLNEQPRGRPPNKLGVVVDVDFTVRPVLSPVSGKGDGDVGQTSGASQSKSHESRDQNPTASPNPKHAETESMEDRRRAAARAARRPASAAAFTPSPTRVLSVVGAASATGRPLTSRPAARGAAQLSADLLRREQGIPRRLRETPMRPGAVETKRVATAREAAAKPAMVFGRNPGGGGGGEGGFDERVRLAAAGATAHSRILLETGKLRPSSAPASRDGRASKMPLRVLPAAERVARAHGHLSAAKECATRKTSTRAQSARKQAFGYSFASSTNAAAGDRTASVIAPFAPRTATLAEKMCGARMNATATRLNAGRGTTSSTTSSKNHSKNHSAHPPRGYWRAEVTGAEDPPFNVSARPMSPTVEHAARPATARVNVRGDGAQPAHVFGAKMRSTTGTAFAAVHTHDAAAHGGRVARGDVDIENVPLAASRNGGPPDGDGPPGTKPPTAKITRPKTEYEEKPGKRDPHDVNAAVFEFGGGKRTGANVTGTIRRQKSWEKVWQ